MSSPDEQPSLSLLNVFDVDTDRGPRRYLCFVDPVTAGARGIDPRSIVGEFPRDLPHPAGPDDLLPNTGFIDTFIVYMNEVAAGSPELQSQAAQNAGKSLYVIDPRLPANVTEEPESHNVLGVFEIDPEGKIVSGSFAYNRMHRWFDEKLGASGVFSDRSFYSWLHPDLGALGAGNAPPDEPTAR